MNDPTPVFDIRELSKLFLARSSLPWREPRVIARALDRVSLQVRPGEILGLAGESGSGKTTLAEILAGLQKPTGGELYYRGQDLGGISKEERVTFRREVQMIFQDPYESLNPRHTILRSVSEPLINAGIRSTRQLTPLVEEALEQAGLRPAAAHLDAYPHQLSGGQRQRVSIARAIALKPKVLIADEPVSMLDVSLRASILKLLRQLRQSLGLTILYISHDLSTMSYVCDRIAILHHGVLKEVGPSQQLFSAPQDPYTRELLAAIPSLAIGD
jgi:peptide/nickel transport system ATP-binding protein